MKRQVKQIDLETLPFRMAYLKDRGEFRWWKQVKNNDKWSDDPRWNGQFDILDVVEFNQRCKAAESMGIEIYDYEVDFYNA